MSNVEPVENQAAVNKGEWRTAGGIAFLVVAVTCLPYLLLSLWTPGDGRFPGILFNSDDHGVYFAWMRQGADGKLLFRNLFTTEPQRGVYFQLFFYLLGRFCAWTGLGIPLVYHAARVLFGWVALLLVYRLGAWFTPDIRARRWVLVVVALSAGLGWLFWGDQVTQREPIDVWQPEALMFPSLYVNGLFSVSLTLMLGVVLCLMASERHGFRWSVGAGVCGLVLGNVHSYDVIHLAFAWAAYLGGRWVVEGRVPGRAIASAVMAATVALPSVAYMAWLYLAEPVFRARADTATLSPHPHLFLLGYGLLIPLALWWQCRQLWPGDAQRHSTRFVQGLIHLGWMVVVVGIAQERGAWPVMVGLPLLTWIVILVGIRKVGSGGEARHQAERAPLRPHMLMLAAWSLAGAAVIYLPFAFQRKLVMGIHVPLAVAAGLALAEWIGGPAGAPLRATSPWVGWTRFADRKRVVALAILIVLPLSNIRWLLRDVSVAVRTGKTSTGIHPVYWLASDLACWEWMGKNTPDGAALITFPLNGSLAPAYSGRAVWAGHWGETPGFADKVGDAVRFYYGPWSGEARLRFLLEHRIDYVFLGPNERISSESMGRQGRYPRAALPLEREPWLREVHRVGESALFRVVAPPQRSAGSPR